MEHADAEEEEEEDIRWRGVLSNRADVQQNGPIHILFWEIHKRIDNALDARIEISQSNVPQDEAL